MAIRNNFTAGEVLAAADLNDTFGSKVDYALPVNAQTGTTYTFALADANKLVSASNAAASTYTVPPQTSVAWAANTVLRVVNYGAGDLTIAGGSGVTVTNAAKTLAQYESAAAIRTGSNAWTLVPFSGGVGNADFSDAATGTYTDGGINYKYATYTGSGTVTITKAGLCDILLIGGGGAAGTDYDSSAGTGGGGGAGGHLYAVGAHLPVGTLTVVVGAGGSTSFRTQSSGGSGSTSRIGDYYSPGGGGGGSWGGFAGLTGGSGGGSGSSSGNGGTGTSGIGNDGGNGSTGTSGGGGGAGGAGTRGTAGAGLANSITGTSVTRAAGGATSGGANGTGNTGNGGAGNTNTLGGTGGSGLFVIRVRTN